MQPPAWNRLSGADLRIDVKMMMFWRAVTGSVDLKVVNRAAILVTGDVVIDAGATAQGAVVAEQLCLREQIKVTARKQE